MVQVLYGLRTAESDWVSEPEAKACRSHGNLHFFVWLLLLSGLAIGARAVSPTLGRNTLLGLLLGVRGIAAARGFLGDVGVLLDKSPPKVLAARGRKHVFWDYHDVFLLHWGFCSEGVE